MPIWPPKSGGGDTKAEPAKASSPFGSKTGASSPSAASSSSSPFGSKAGASSPASSSSSSSPFGKSAKEKEEAEKKKKEEEEKEKKKKEEEEKKKKEEAEAEEEKKKKELKEAEEAEKKKKQEEEEAAAAAAAAAAAGGGEGEASPGSPASEDSSSSASPALPPFDPNNHVDRLRVFNAIVTQRNLTPIAELIQKHSSLADDPFWEAMNSGIQQQQQGQEQGQQTIIDITPFRTGEAFSQHLEQNPTLLQDLGILVPSSSSSSSPSGSSPTSSSSSSPTAAASGGEGGEGSLPVPSPDQKTYDLRTKVQSLYRVYNPANVGQVDAILSQFEPEEEPILWDSLSSKYGPEHTVNFKEDQAFSEYLRNVNPLLDRYQVLMQKQPPVDPDVHLQPALRRLLQTIEPLHPTFAAMLAGDFVIPWPKGATECPPFDPLAQPSVKKALKLKGESAMALHSLCITARNQIVLMGANGLMQQTITTSEMRKIQLVRASRKDPSILIVDLIDPEKPEKRSTAFYVLLTGMTSSDRAELACKNSLAGVELDVLEKPPEVKMPDLAPLLKRMKVRTEEHDALIKERTALLERIRKLQLQSIARSAVAKLSVECEDAPEQEMSRQTMLNLLVNYICGSVPRSKGEYY